MGGEESDREVLYHQLATDETEEAEEEERRRIFRPRVNHNSIMELSIHNRRLFFICLALIEAFGISAVILSVSLGDQHKGWGDLCGEYGNPLKQAPHPHDHLPHLSLWQRSSDLQDHPPKNEGHKLKLKLAHAGIMIVAFALMVIGLQAAFDSHNKPDPPKPNMYTLHSWVGLLAALLFGCQWGLGFAAFLFPKFSPEIRALLLPFHQYFGSSILALAVAAAWIGHLEKMIWSNMAGYVAKDSGTDCEHDGLVPHPLCHGGHLPSQQVLQGSEAWRCLKIDFQYYVIVDMLLNIFCIK